MTEAAKTGSRTLLWVNDLKKYYPLEVGFFRKVTGYIRAVDGVTFELSERETLGLVGESGCGKSTLGKCILRGIEPTGGTVKLRLPDDRIVDVTSLDKRGLRAIRPYMQMIFQNPYSSLDPRKSVLDIVGEPLRINKVAKGQELVDRVAELLQAVGLEKDHMRRYPHAFSGGQRQRIGIARALALNPKLIVADEPVSALDVSIQAQIVNLLQDLQERFGLSYLFISHDLSVTRHISDRIAVMYVGQIVELADSEALFEKPRHPYTEALLSAAPRPGTGRRRERIVLTGEVANPVSPPKGCRFHPRCRYAEEICKVEPPAWREVAPGHFAACHFAEELNLTGAGERRPRAGAL